MSEENMLSTKEVLARLKISRKTLYALIERGKIKPIEKPSYLERAFKLQFRESDVTRLLMGDDSDDDKEAHAKKGHIAA